MSAESSTLFGIVTFAIQGDGVGPSRSRADLREVPGLQLPISAHDDPCDRHGESLGR